MLNYCPDKWRTARLEIYKHGLEGWLVVREAVTVRPDDRVYSMRQAFAKEYKARLQDVRLVPLLDCE